MEYIVIYVLTILIGALVALPVFKYFDRRAKERGEYDERY